MRNHHILTMSLFVLVISFFTNSKAQTDVQQKASETPFPPIKEDYPLKFKLNDDGSHYFQATFLNQAWFRFNNSNPGTTVLTQPREHTFDIGLRRTRIQMYGQITDRAFIYFQAGMNNFNFLYNGQGVQTNNRIVSFYFHDALCEYRVTKGNQLKIGGGLSIANGLSRFTNPSVGTILAVDLPVFAQATVNATDLFNRKLSVYARGQIKKIDYRFMLSDPFPPTTAQGGNGVNSFDRLGNINVSNFSSRKHYLQQQAYLMYQFFDQESHLTPYMTGSYLGKKKVFNIAGGIIFQKDAMWKKTGTAMGDTSFQNLLCWAVESFFDRPFNVDKGTAITAYVGYFHTDYGSNYVRTQAQMNPADGVSPSFSNSISGSGNGWPMFGTGNVIYAQAGYLFKRDLLGSQGTLQPYVTYQRNDFRALSNIVNVYSAGVNWLINGHKAKVTFDYQNRPVFNNVALGDPSGNKPDKSGRRSCFIIQYQIYI